MGSILVWLATTTAMGPWLSADFNDFVKIVHICFELRIAPEIVYGTLQVILQHSGLRSTHVKVEVLFKAKGCEEEHPHMMSLNTASGARVASSGKITRTMKFDALSCMGSSIIDKIQLLWVSSQCGHPQYSLIVSSFQMYIKCCCCRRQAL